jgi:hypothetical protein
MAGVATLHLRNVPPEVDAALTADARARGVSKNRRAIEALRRGLGLDQVERSRLVDEIRRGRRPVDVDLAELVRGDRPAGSA